ncbi:MAG: hypothetical protein Q7T62_07800 [Undibacterium sp.]|nr:hypothetical protein [Undibacterium sp.]
MLLSLSEEARTNLYRNITDEGGFICVESLENQMVFIRRSAIADIYFSSDAYDDYGPEVYEQSLGLLPDDSFWRVVEFSDCLDAIEDDIDKIFIDEVISKILLSEVDLAKLKSSQDLSDQELNQIKEDADKLNQRFINRAQNISWQLSSGKQRSENVNENRLIYDVFGTFKFENLDPIICLPVEDYHRTIFINTSVVDYISIPAHKFRDGEIECLENEIDRSERK